MKILILISIFIVELLKYWLGMRLCFNARIIRAWSAFVGLGIYIVAIYRGNLSESEVRLVMFAIVILVLIISVEADGRQKILRILMLVFVITCVDELIGIPVDIFINRPVGDLQMSNLKYLCGSSISFLIIVIIAILNKRNDIFHNYKVIKFIRKRISIIVLIMGLFLLMTIAGLNYARSYILSERFAIYTTIVSMTALCAVGILGTFMIYIKNTNEKMEQLIEAERKLKDMHIKYYESLLEKEEDTRRYRHDLNNHLICLSELAKSEKAELVIDYIKRMQNQMNDIQKKCYFVGNEILDAILNYYLPMLKADVKITVKGKCTSTWEVNNVDLCTIFSNLIQNAVEELMSESEEEKHLIVRVNQGKEFSQIEIINSVSSADDDINGNFLKTKKVDKKNHGIGLQNVKDTVERYGGKLEIKKENRNFIVTIIVKNKIN